MPSTRARSYIIFQYCLSYTPVMGDFDRYARLTADFDAPYAVIDLAAFRRNADDLVRRAAGTPIRIASKSVRCHALISAALSAPASTV